MEFRVLAVGDVVGAPGLRFLQQKLRGIKRLYGADFCVVNGENANVVGITPQQADAIFDAGADVITLGNHTWNRLQIADFLEKDRYTLRPANYTDRQTSCRACPVAAGAFLRRRQDRSRLSI